VSAVAVLAGANSSASVVLKPDPPHPWSQVYHDFIEWRSGRNDVLQYVSLQELIEQEQVVRMRGALPALPPPSGEERPEQHFWLDLPSLDDSITVGVLLQLIGSAAVIYVLLVYCVAKLRWAIRLTVLGAGILLCSFIRYILDFCDRVFCKRPMLVANFDKVLESKQGFYVQGTTRFFRDITGLYTVTPTGATVENHDFIKGAKVHYKLKKADTPPPGLGESAILGSSSLPVSTLSKGQLKISTVEGDHHSCGIRIQDCLVMCRHSTNSMTSIHITGPNGTICVDLDRAANRRNKSNQELLCDRSYETTPRDLLYIKLSPKEWAVSGVKAWSEKETSRMSTGTCSIAGHDSYGKLSKWSGKLVESGVYAQLGIGFHKVTTYPGFSGAPVVSSNGNASVLVGIHMGSPTDHMKKVAGCEVNVFVGIEAVLEYGIACGLIDDPLTAAAERLTELWRGESGKEKNRRMWESYEQLDDRIDRWYQAGELTNALDDAWEQQINSYMHGGEGDDINSGWDIRTHKLFGGAPEGRGKRAMRHRPAEDGDTQSQGGRGESAFKVQAEFPPVICSHAETPKPCPVKKRHMTEEEGTACLTHILWGRGDEMLKEHKPQECDPRALLKLHCMAPLVHYMESCPSPIENDDVGDINYERQRSPEGDLLSAIPACKYVGRYKFRTGREKNKKTWIDDHHEIIEKAIDSWCSVSGDEKKEYSMPEMTKKELIKSLQVQFGSMSPRKGLTGAQKRKLKAKIEELAESRKYIVRNTPFCERQHGMITALKNFENTSAGWSAHWKGGTKKAIVDKNPDEVLAVALCRVLMLICLGEDAAFMRPKELVELGAMDPRELFVKNEPHEARKAKVGKYRVIWNYSLIDAAVQSFFHKVHNNDEIAGYKTKTTDGHSLGMGHDDEGLKRTMEAVRNHLGEGDIVSCDASGWDLSLSRELVLIDTLYRLQFNTNPFYVAGVRAVGYVNSCHLAAAKGDFYEVYGVTGSGGLSTAAQNTSTRTVTSDACGAKASFCAGDDLLGGVPVPLEWKQGLEELGIRLRDLETRKYWEGFSFTSHEYFPEHGIATFQNVQKMLTSLKNTDNPYSKLAAMAVGMKFAVRHTPIAGIKMDLLFDALGVTYAQEMLVEGDHDELLRELL